MRKFLIYYDEECEQIADTIIDNYRSHDVYCEKICTTIQDDIEYAEKMDSVMQYLLKSMKS